MALQWVAAEITINDDAGQRCFHGSLGTQSLHTGVWPFSGLLLKIPSMMMQVKGAFRAAWEAVSAQVYLPSVGA